MSLGIYPFVMVVTHSVALQVSERFGFGLQVQADGIFNLKVIKVLVKLVEPGSQACRNHRFTVVQEAIFKSYRKILGSFDKMKTEY